MVIPELTYDNAADLIGQEIGVTDWLAITQDEVNTFAEVTRDLDWMHIDPERAAKESPYGHTIVFGFQTMSMIAYFSHEVGLWPKNTSHGLNYGCNKLRFISPVPVGGRIRARFLLKGFELEDHGGYRATFDVTIEIENSERPAMFAEWLTMFYPEGSAP